MKIDEINSMSLDDLWSLHEKLNSMLSKRLPEEKKRLERRIQQLNRAVKFLLIVIVALPLHRQLRFARFPVEFSDSLLRVLRNVHEHRSGSA